MPKEANPFGKKLEDWGKTKFKPTLKEAANRSSQNPFTKPQNFNITGDRENGRFNKGGFNGGNDRRSFNGHKSRGGGGGRFDGRRNNRGTGNYQKDKGDRVKFNPIARDAKPDFATPWMKFKDEINYKQREETQAASQANMDTEEAKNVIKQREMNYRRLLMEEKKLETTLWEDFGENDPHEGDNIKIKNKHTKLANTLSLNMENNKSNKKHKDTNKKKKNKPSANKQDIETEHAESKSNVYQENVEMAKPNIDDHSTNAKNKSKKKKQFQRAELVTDVDNNSVAIKEDHRKTENTNNTETTVDDGEEVSRNKLKKMRKLHKRNGTALKDVVESKKPKTLLSNEELKNFDGKNMSFQQKDALRRIITKGVTFQKGTNLEQCLNNRKYQFACKENKKKNKK